MNRITLLSLSLVCGAALPALAQKDTRPATSMKVPSKSAAVADAAQKGDLAMVKKLSHLPVIADPSHGAGRRDHDERGGHRRE